MRSRSRSRRRAKTHRRHRVKTHRRSFRGRGGAITTQELYNQIQHVPAFRFDKNEKKFNEKLFDKAKEWFDNTFHQVEQPRQWEDVLWPNYAKADRMNILSNVLDDDEKKENKSGYWTAKSTVNRMTEFLVSFLKERIRKTESTAFKFGRFFNPMERFEKLKEDATAINVFVKALKGLSDKTEVGNNSLSDEGFGKSIFQLNQLINHALDIVKEAENKNKA